MTLLPGTIIDGKYRINRVLGAGGMGAVYEGENERIHRRVAIKILHAEVSDRADIVQRFEREAQAAGRIGSAHIVEVLDLGSLASGERFMVMEYLDGESLGARIKKRERMTPHEFTPILHALLEGLASAHEAHIIHRDIKPDNVYLVNAKNRPDFVKILDFGVSKFTAVENELGKTGTGMIMGTPYYMSPEQIRAEQLDARSDLYSIGVIVYYAITGRLPFKATGLNELAIKITTMEAEPPESVVALDPQFAAIIVKAMHRDREMRFQSAREFQAAVASWMETNSVQAPYQRMNSSVSASMPSPGMLAETSRTSQPISASFLNGEARTGPSRSSISGGIVFPTQPGAVQLGTSHVTPIGTLNTGLAPVQQGAPVLVRPNQGNGMMIALGLCGTLFLAVCALLVYAFVFDKPTADAPMATPSVAVAAPSPPPPVPQPSPLPSAAAEPVPSALPTTSAAASSNVPTVAPSASVVPVKTSTTSVGGGAKPPKPPPSTGGGRKITGEL